MRKRLIQVFGFLASSLGWLFVLCSMAMDYWRITQIGGQAGSWIIKVAWYWSNLWKDCYTDSTAITNCRDYPVLWSVACECCSVAPMTYSGASLICIKLCRNRNPVVFLHDRASLPHFSLRRESSVFL